MIIPDVNLLLYATITVFPQHQRARTWWEDVINSSAPIGLSAPAIFGFLRIATSTRVFTPPMAVDVATGHVRDWLDQPNVELLRPTQRQLEIALGLLEAVGTAGNLTTDAQLAAHAMDCGAELHSNDSDFGRFSELAWINPLA